MTRRNEPLQIIWRLCLVVLLGLSATSSAAQKRSAQPSEGEIAMELFGLIADQSGCPKFVVAWVDRATQQVQAKCAETIDQSQQILTSTVAETRFLLDIETAKADYKNGFGLTSMQRSTAVLAHLLTNGHAERHSKKYRAPLLLYLQIDQRKTSTEMVRTSVPDRGGARSFIVFKN